MTVSSDCACKDGLPHGRGWMHQPGSYICHRLCTAPLLPSSADLVSILTIIAGMTIVQGQWRLGKKNGLMRERTRRVLLLHDEDTR
jgi:hypothetical protein